jgi:hypothetical protein
MVKSVRRLLASVLLSTLFVACDKQHPEEAPASEPSDELQCIVNWSGTLPTAAREFRVQACRNEACSIALAIQAAESNSGTVNDADAGCTTTAPGGLPSSCSPPFPTNSPPGCTVGSIGSDLSVQACAQIVSQTETAFSIILTPSPTVLQDGDEFVLKIETPSGEKLVETHVDVAHYDLVSEGDQSCRGASLSLDGARIHE